MNKKTYPIFLFAILLFLSINISAQNGLNVEQIREKFSSIYEQSEGITAKFTTTAYHNEKITGKTSGKIDLQSEKYFLDTPEIKNWFDGKTQWSLLNNSEEVNISEPTEQEIESINPYYLLTNKETNYKFQLGKTNKLKGHNCYELIIKYNNKTEFKVYISKLNFHPLMITAYLSSQEYSNIWIDSFDTKAKFSDSHFRFNEEKNPEIDVIDLR